MRIWLLTGLLFATALSGCASDGSSTTDDGDDAAFDDLATDTPTDKGLIRGVVVDAAVAPIADATVGLQGSEAQTRTNEGGAFVFTGLDAGTYFVTVSKPGYETVQTSATVQAGLDKPPILKVQLPKAPGTEPFARYATFTGYIGCSVQVANLVQDNVCGIAGGIDPDQHEVFDFGTTQMPELVQTELVWEYSQILGQRLGTIQYMVQEDGSLDRMGNIWGESPLVCKVDAENECDNGDGTGGGGGGLNATGFSGVVTTRVFANCFQTCVPGTAVGLGLVLQQDYDLYGAAFFNFRPADDWTFSLDGEAPVPSR